MSVLQWNMRSFSVQRDDLRFLLSCHSPKVVCLQEPLLSADPVPVPGYNFLGTPHSLYDSCILLHHSAPFERLSCPTTLPCTFVRVYLDRWVTIVSLYFSPSVPIDFASFSALLAGLPPPFLVLGDFNCRHALWGDSVTNSRGRLMELFLRSHDLCVLNTGSPTHIDARTRSFSCIDLSLCSPSLLVHFQWSVLENSPYSDHLPILILPTSNSRVPGPPRWCFQRADWPSFTSLSSPQVAPSELSSVHDMLLVFLVTVGCAALAAIPRTSRCFESRCVPWWSLDCSRDLRVKRATWKSFKRKRLTPGGARAFLIFRRAAACLRRTVKSAKRKSWTSYVSSVTSFTSVKSVWKRIHKLSGKRKPPHSPVLHVDGESVADSLAVATQLGVYISSVSSGSHLPPEFHVRKAEAESSPVVFTLSSDESYNASFSSRELVSALHACKDTAAGPDGVHYLMLKHLSQPALSFLLSLYNKIWSTGVFPPSWNTALTLPFLKPNKRGFSPQDYRPIVLTSCLCKVLERMVNARLMWVLESRQLLSSSQFGFRRGRSTLDPLVCLDTYVKSAFARGDSVLAVFFDLEKAYDSTWKHHVLSCLRDLRIVGNMGVFLSNFLSSRTFRVRVGDAISQQFPQVEGVPQGGVVSTTLFIIAINGIVSSLPSGVRSSLYVDDFAVYAADSDPEALRSLIQSAVDAASAWATSHGFRFSVAKSCALTFSRRRVIPQPPLTLYDSPLPYRSFTTFLGLVLDSRLTWSAHVSSLKADASRRLSILQTLSHVSWGADRTLLLRLHTVLVLSKLDYGCQVFSSASDAVLRRLDSVHHAGLRLALGAFRSSPVESLYAESGFHSLYRRRTLLSLRYYARSVQLPSLSAPLTPPDPPPPQLRLQPLVSRMQSVLSHTDLGPLHVLPLRFGDCPFWLQPRPPVCQSILPCSKSSTPPEVLKSAFQDHLPVHSRSTHVYTDGSRSSSGVGFAILFPSRSYQFSLPPVAGILSAELYAILFALRYICFSCEESFTVFTDSYSALLLIQSFPAVHPLVVAILDWLFRISVRKKSVRFCWVPSHVGVVGNEKVDALARTAAAAVPRPLSLPAADYYPAFSSFIQSRWQSDWSSIASNKLRTVKASVTPWEAPSHRARRWETALARLRIGHTRLTHAFLMTRSPPPVCARCDVQLSVSHILLTCPLYSIARTRHFPFLSVLQRPPRLSDILAESPSFSITSIMSFLDSIHHLHDI